MSHPLPEMIAAAIEQIRGTVDVNTSIGDPITTPDGLTVIPVSKVSFGIGGGGADYAMKHPSASGTNPFGGGSGAAVTIQPLAFLVLKGESVRLLPIAEPASSSLERLVEMIPEVLTKLSSLKKKKDDEDDLDDQEPIEDVSEF